MAGTLKLYDLLTDKFITERAKIIDVLVERAAGMLTFSTRQPKPGEYAGLSDPAIRRLLFASKMSSRELVGLYYTVRLLWRDEVAR